MLDQHTQDRKHGSTEGTRHGGFSRTRGFSMYRAYRRDASMTMCNTCAPTFKFKVHVHGVTATSHTRIMYIEAGVRPGHGVGIALCFARDANPLSHLGL